MTHRYSLSARAERELDEIADYTFERWGRQKAIDYIDRLRARFRWLVENPDLGRRRPELSPEIRSFPEGSHVVFYRVKGETFEVVRILHRAREMSDGWEES